MKLPRKSTNDRHKVRSMSNFRYAMTIMFNAITVADLHEVKCAWRGKNH